MIPENQDVFNEDSAAALSFSATFPVAEAAAVSQKGLGLD